MNIDSLYSKFLVIKNISTDTRKSVSGSIFFCLKGLNFNGNKFAYEALKKGAELVVIDEKQKTNEEKFLFVPDVLTCLQNLAKKHRENLNIPIIAITGTNGKTSTKNIVFDVLSTKFNVMKTTGNFNNHIGLPLSILKIDKSYDLAVLEFGASKIGDINELCDIGKPNIGLITNIGKAHLEEFESIDNIIKTKTELWTYLIKTNGTIFINQEDENLITTRAKHKIFSTYNKFINYGKKENEIKLNSKSLFLEFTWRNELIKTKIVGDYNLNNVIASIALGNFFKVGKKDIINKLKDLSFKNNRSEFIKTNFNEIILDAYNANPTSMKFSINSFINISSNMEKTLILGDMLELGGKSKELHQELIKFLKIKKIKSCLLVGENFNEIECDFLKFKTKKNLEVHLKKHMFKKRIILIKGSRKMKLETLKELL
tara:strand:+ start:854 stop:2140 length:1287 start_codon:yes stop_codon:yes gene_type:complete